ncbi:hypothetical protein BDW60DRAFT_30343 [Aspergillus nidulans var. acristatus]|jgi:uncharacterized MAPEG superfamily protein
MALLTTLGLTLGLTSTPPGLTIPNLGPAALAFNFIFAYGLLSSRTIKQYYGIDHNVSPREDVAKYGDAAVQSGKISQKTLDMIKRNESAHANAVENYALLVGAVAMATVAGVERVSINRAVVLYTLARTAYAVVYITIDTPRLSQLRGVCWWVGNLCCLNLLRKAASLLGAE